MSDAFVLARIRELEAWLAPGQAAGAAGRAEDQDREQDRLEALVRGALTADGGPAFDVERFVEGVATGSQKMQAEGRSRRFLRDVFEAFVFGG